MQLRTSQASYKHTWKMILSILNLMLYYTFIRFKRRDAVLPFMSEKHRSSFYLLSISIFRGAGENSINGIRVQNLFQLERSDLAQGSDLSVQMCVQMSTDGPQDNMSMKFIYIVTERHSSTEVRSPKGGSANFKLAEYVFTKSARRVAAKLCLETRIGIEF
ncbi:hypothetical protein BCR41DRAFT_383807 [Lobosporangium transversale]|uniref:Uncharacterized protein n=1 Tax=Lobosporangium transversale TaxID=64571 RepID=A0A1Y2H0W0_9FUNG|nr:hypothetical protein BCR41DRAFT_383807 [Lobosporangium transversale]ORZ27363.1 hypothetical protein BCR41DRAFT_383807 [Lobosporangium transversale]|eukprot:XP_021885090.1 hypothetical protein BCR41DRAFT_383807 [Lobosporangium transversale]